ncbi:MAG: DUF1461 domain-containing protein [Gaiellales bacterium]
MTVVVVNGFRLVATETFVRAEYAHGDLPPDIALGRDERRRLALVGLRSIRPRTPGIELLERETLPSGEPAFGRRELSHMHDVRALFIRALRLQTALAALLVAAGAAFARTRWRSVVPTGLLAGGLATLGVAAAIVPVLALGFETVFVRFHGLFFDGDTWRFARTDTLLRIYPKEFWVDTSTVIAMLVVAQAVLVAALGWWWRRRVGR